MIKKIDHLVITSKDIEATLAFYQELGFTPRIQRNRHELHANNFKINVHTLGKELSPHAQNVQTGSSDFCFEIEGNLKEFRQQLLNRGLSIELGIVERQGALGTMQSIYLRDPDGNLVEIGSYA